MKSKLKEEMGKVLADFYTYITTFGEGEDHVCGTQCIVADQLYLKCFKTFAFRFQMLQIIRVSN